MQQAAVTFGNPNSTPAQVESAGEKVLVAIYNGKCTDTLNALRHKKYSDKVVVNMTQVDPKNLPPTFAAAKFHSFHVFLQINQWKKSDCDVIPESWGWTRTESGLMPILTDQPPAPEELLKMIRCNSGSDCSSAKCSCKKNGMQCSIACGQCHGTACSNAGEFLFADDDDDHNENIDIAVVREENA